MLVSGWVVSCNRVTSLVMGWIVFRVTSNKHTGGPAESKSCCADNPKLHKFSDKSPNSRIIPNLKSTIHARFFLYLEEVEYLAGQEDGIDKCRDGGTQAEW